MAPETAPRIALFVPTLDGGGAERVMVRLANAFHRRGLVVDLLLARAIGPWLAEVASGVHLRELGGGGVLKALPALVSYLRASRPAGLLATLDHANLVAIWGRALSGTTARVVVRQAADPTGVEPDTTAGVVIDRLLGPSYRRSDEVVVLTQAMKLAMVRAKRLDPDRVRVIPNPVLVADIRTLAQAETGHPWLDDRARAGTAPPVVVAVGRLQAQKDYPMLLRAIAQVAQRRPVRLVILGEGPDHGALVALAESLGIAAITHFAGFQPNPYPWLDRAAVVALASRVEGMPNVLLEALALGTPVVSTDCPTGPREVLDAGRLGALVAIGDDAALARAIGAVLAGDHPSAAALRAGVEPYALDGIASRYLESLLGQDGRQHAA